MKPDTIKAKIYSQHLEAGHSFDYFGGSLGKWLSDTSYKEYIKITADIKKDPYAVWSIQITGKERLKKLLCQYVRLFEKDNLIASEN